MCWTSGQGDNGRRYPPEYRIVFQYRHLQKRFDASKIRHVALAKGGLSLKLYETARIRNVAFIGHAGCGKTQLSEALLFATGVTSRMGKVDDGNTVSDWDPEEAKRRITISTALLPYEWKEHKINVLDTPGYFDFVGDVIGALHAADATLCVVCAAAGVEVGTEQVWALAAQRNLPSALFINKMDRENANFARTLQQLQETLTGNIVPLQAPIGEAASFEGFIDLLSMQAYSADGEPFAAESVPDNALAAAQQYREQLLEAVAATDDELTLKYLEEEPITADELRHALVSAVHAGRLTPVWLGSALQGAGAHALLDGIVANLPSPLDSSDIAAKDVKAGESVLLTAAPEGPTAAFVFKTISDPYVGRLTMFRVRSGTIRPDGAVYNVDKQRDERVTQLFTLRGKEQLVVPALVAGDIGAVSKLHVTATGDSLADKGRPLKVPALELPRASLTMALVPKAKGDEDKISVGLTRLTEEDVTLTVDKDGTTGELLIAGLGELQLEIATARLQAQYGVQVDLITPQIAYRETIRGTVKQEGRHKKQSGGRGQFGHVFIELAPLPSGGGFEFVDKIFGGAVPRQYIPAVEKGILETMGEGVLAGYPVVDVRVTLYDGSYHSVDSSEMAFKIAASIAFKDGFMKAQPVLLEPIMLVEVTVPERYMGDVIGDLNRKRGRIVGMDPQDGLQLVRAHVPMAELTRYAVDLRSITQGRGAFAVQLAHYEEMPDHLAGVLISAAADKGA